MAEAGASRGDADLRRLRRRIDRLDRRIVALMNERARLGLLAGAAKASAGRGGVLDTDREREVLLRVAMANDGPLPQPELLAVYRRLILATRRLELAERRRGHEPDEPPAGAGYGRPADGAAGATPGDGQAD